MIKKIFTFATMLLLLYSCTESQVEETQDDDEVIDPDTDTDTEENAGGEYDWEELSYQQIDFDATYGTCSGSTLVANIKDAISKASEDEIIVFNREVYDFEFAVLKIESPARLSGKIPSEIDGNTMGAQNIYTVFDNVDYFNVQTNDVQFYNMEIVGTADEYGMLKISDGASNYEVATNIREGIKVSNVRLLNNYASIYGGNGLGIDIQYCTFRDYTRAGFLLNRKGINDVAPRTTIRYCTFDSYLSDYDCRGISFDSGNTEYPIVLDLSETLIESCYFYKTGVSFSKSGNATIQNCHFKSNTMYMDMIHVEEYGNRITITNNIFEHESPSRGIYLDRERQIVSDITVTNNTFIGEVGWVISAYSPINLTFENNDFSQATFSRSTSFPYDFDFCYYRSDEEHEEYDFEIPAQNVVIRNNTGLSSTGGMRIYTEEGNNTNTIYYTGAEIEEVPAVVPPVDDGNYYFKNLATGQYISYSSSGYYLSVSDAPDATSLWGLQFMDPQNYAITTSSGLYMEAYTVYTLSNIENGSSPGETLLRKSSYVSDGDNRVVPTFVFQHPTDNEYAKYYIIYPGSNERKSAVGIIDGCVDLAYGSVVRDEPENYTNCLWTLVKAN